MRRLAKIRFLIVFLVWLGAMGLLFKREIYPSLSAQKDRIAPLEEISPTLVRDQWMGIFYRDDQVGYSHTALFPRKEEGFYGSVLENTLWLDLPLPGRTTRVRAHSSVLIDTSGRIHEISLDASSSLPPVILRATDRGGELAMTISAGGKEKQFTIPLQKRELPVYALGPFLAFRTLKEGKTFTLSALDPLRGLGGGKIESGEIRFRVLSRDPEGWRLEADYAGMTLEIRLDRKGELERVTTPIGWELVKQEHGTVMEFLTAQGEKKMTNVRNELK